MGTGCYQWAPLGVVPLFVVLVCSFSFGSTTRVYLRRFCNWIRMVHQFWTLLALLARNQNRPTEDSTRVNDWDRRAGASRPDSDDPIESWEQDLLDRAPIIDSAAFSLLISRTPTLALYGPLGAGKTSILNLLSLHLRKRAIVVFFSTWLPGSADTLSSYLLEDISRQCRKEFVIPGMRKSARRLALALAKRVPLLDAFPISSRSQLNEKKFRTSQAPSPGFLSVSSCYSMKLIEWGNRSWNRC